MCFPTHPTVTYRTWGFKKQIFEPWCTSWSINQRCWESSQLSNTCFGWTLYCTKPCFVMLCSTNILFFFFPLFPSNLHSIFQLPTSSLRHKILILALSRDPQKKLHAVWRECKMSRCPDVSATTPHLASMWANSGVSQFVGACLLRLYFTIWPNTGKCSNGNTSCNISSVVAEFPLKCSLVE